MDGAARPMKEKGKRQNFVIAPLSRRGPVALNKRREKFSSSSSTIEIPAGLRTAAEEGKRKKFNSNTAS